MSGAGELYEKVAFDRLEAIDDGYGGTVDQWTEQFTRRAGYTRLRGTEPVMAARLEGKQPTVIRVRVDSETRQITTDWRARDARSGEAFNIRSIARTNDRRWFDILAESGVAV
ncbi:MAG: head-tail adaptor protein [Rhizobiaceae bacterium]|nr:head-tail adaptor protein [Rhizobiaceae bacterium]MCV0406328.1 head-tail adaptor protein [Rhizobiaceae bacterium]